VRLLCVIQGVRGFLLSSVFALCAGLGCGCCALRFCVGVGGYRDGIGTRREVKDVESRGEEMEMEMKWKKE
jgi:hypothetical protein